MARRSLKASTTGIEKAKKAFKVREWTQDYLASEVGLETRQPIWKFFTGKPIERQSFMEICFQLGLDWQEIAELPNQSLLTEENNQDGDRCQDIDTLVQSTRSRRSDKIQAQCATTRLLDIAQPIELEDIYVSVNILNHIISQRWSNILDLQGFVPEEFDRFDLAQVCQERIPAMQAVTTYPKLIILGKPGSGKTTFLQYLATQCNQGKLLSDKIPIFLRLRNFAEDAREIGNYSLLNYINQALAGFGASDQDIQTILAHGRMLILLDGLDEIPEDNSVEIIKSICKFSEEYYKNQFIITCRIAALQYQFEGFTEIEIADFNQFQIQAFVQNWFINVARNSIEEGKAKTCQFMQKLQLWENREIRELTVTPLLLNLVCCVFQARLDFPTRRVEFYKEALKILLYQCDKARGIKRDRVYSFSLLHKLNLLSQIAAITFKQDCYFFTQSQVECYIADSLHNLPNAPTERELLQLNSEVVLKLFEIHGLLIERAHLIYSFSYLAFQEYLTARDIVANTEPQILKGKLIDLVSHLTEPRWRNVFLLTAGMLDNATYLLQLMKQHIDGLVTFDKQLQKFLIWLNQKSLSVQAPYKSAAIRAFYLTLVLPDDLMLSDNQALSVAIDPRLASNLAPDLKIDLALKCAFYLSLALPKDPALDRVIALNFTLCENQTLICNPELQLWLQQLKEKLPCPAQGKERLKEWWNTSGQAWIETLRSVMVRYRNIGQQWQFSEQHKQVLKQYYIANQLLVDCVNSSCKVSSTVRETILETLLLPVKASSSALSNYRSAVGATDSIR
jgi:predicted NACHT family NTPase